MDPRIEPVEPLDSQALEAVQSALNYSLPAGYRAFLENFGSAFVGGCVDNLDEFPVLAFFNEEQILRRLTRYADLRDEGILPIADCELGNLWVLDCKVDQSVHYINYYGGQTKVQKVADTFEEFINRIVIHEEEA